MTRQETVQATSTSWISSTHAFRSSPDIFTWHNKFFRQASGGEIKLMYKIVFWHGIKVVKRFKIGMRNKECVLTLDPEAWIAFSIAGISAFTWEREKGIHLREKSIHLIQRYSLNRELFTPVLCNDVSRQWHEVDWRNIGRTKGKVFKVSLFRPKCRHWYE